jgi:hypothetical protein
MAKAEEEKNRQEPPGQVKRELWVLSGNECAWDGCNQRLLDDDGAWIGKIAHIVGAEEGSARHDPTWTRDQLREVSNLLLLCANHHDKIDHVDSRDQYPVDFLREIKAKHEARFRRAFEGFEEEFLNVNGRNLVTQCTTLNRFLLVGDEEERVGNVEAVNRIANYLATLTLGARQVLAFLVSLDRPIDIYELARHNGESEPVRTHRLVLELENRKIARVEDDYDVTNQVVLWSDASGSILDGWVDFWWELREHLASRGDATLDDVIVDLDFSLLD